MLIYADYTCLRFRALLCVCVCPRLVFVVIISLLERLLGIRFALLCVCVREYVCLNVCVLHVYSNSNPV